MTASPHQRLLRLVDELLQLSNEALDNMELPAEIEKMVLLGILRKVTERISAVVVLCDGHHSGSVTLLARSVMDGWFIGEYILTEDSHGRAARYMAKALRANRTFFERMVELGRRHPDDVARFLTTLGVGSVEDLAGKAQVLTEEIASMEAMGGSNRFPNLEQCAHSLGPMYEITYAQVYGLLFSDEVHLGPVATLKFIWRVDDQSDGILHDERILLTIAGQYLELLHAASEQLGRPDRLDLEPFDVALAALHAEARAR